MSAVRAFTAPTAGDLRALAQLQSQHGQLFRDLEMPQPVPGATETPREYRIRLLSELKRHSDQWVRADLSMLPAGTLAAIEPLILADAMTAANDPTIGSFRHRGEMRAVRRVDQSGNETTEFHGDPRSWMNQFCSPVVAAVKMFNTGRR